MITVKLECQESLRQSRRKHHNVYCPCWTCVCTMHMRVLCRKKWLTRCMAIKGGRARSLHWSSFRENATNILTFIARWVHDSIFRTNRGSRGKMLLNRKTHRHNDYCNSRCTCTLRVKYDMRLCKDIWLPNFWMQGERKRTLVECNALLVRWKGPN